MGFHAPKALQQITTGFRKKGEILCVTRPDYREVPITMHKCFHLNGWCKIMAIIVYDHENN